jgi:hypothetical protein
MFRRPLAVEQQHDGWNRYLTDNAGNNYAGVTDRVVRPNAALGKLILPFNDRLGPGENLCRGLPGPGLLPQYFEPVPSYGLAVNNDRLVSGDHPVVLSFGSASVIF